MSYADYTRHRPDEPTAAPVTLTYDSWGPSPELRAFLDAHLWTCPTCGGTWEYEDDGPHGCQPCNSRLVFFVDQDGETQSLDYGDSVIIEDGAATISRAADRAT